jgi:hypothetical protein
MSSAAVQANPVGRPTSLTPDIITLLEKGAAIGLKGLEMPYYAGISKSAYYAHLEANPKFKERLEVLRTSPVAKAREVMLDAMESDNEWAKVNAAKFHIEKVDGKAKQNIHIQDDMTITVQRKMYDALPEPEPCEVLNVVDENE